MKISFITAYDTEINIGGEYNRLINKTGDEYIFLKDGDCMFLSSDYGDKIAKIIDSNREYDIIGCRTNRLSSDEQRIDNMFNVSDINKHIEYEKELWELNGTKVIQTNRCVAAMMMIIKRKVWESIKFKDNSITFDRLFCEDAIRQGYKIGIAQGLYVFHLYRWGKEKPEIYINHLNKDGKN